MRACVPVTVFLLRLPPDWHPARDRATPPKWLADDDRPRFQSMLSLSRRAEFAAGRLLLRHALAVCHPEMRWRLVAPPGQAPRLEVSDGGKLACAVSITHSAGQVACAVSAARRLGVDLECHGARRRDFADIVQATLHPLEQADMARLPAAQRRNHFLRCWTLKEALAKALGVGLSLPFREFAFSGDRLAASPGCWPGQHEHWVFASPDAGPDATLGIACATVGGAAVPLSVRAVDLQQLSEIVAR